MLGARKIVNAIPYIKNTNTNRWIKQNGATGTKFMTANNLTRIGNVAATNVAKYTNVQERNIKDWKRIEFLRPTPVSLSLMVNGILALRKDNMRNIMITVRGVMPDGVNDFFSIRMTDQTTKNELLGKLTNAQGNVLRPIGSDMLDIGTEIDTTFFRLSYKQDPVGHGGRKDLAIIKTEYFRCNSYPAEHGDCLFAILKNGKHIATIRKDLGMIGGIKVEDMQKIEEYFQVNINVLYNTVVIQKTEKDTAKTNLTIVTYEYEYYHKSSDKYQKTYDILLHENHYSEIIEKKELFFDIVCGDKLKVVGGVPIELSKLAIRKSLTRQGRRIAGDKKEDGVAFTTKFLFFDIETVFNPLDDCLLEPYSVAWHVADSENPRKFNEKNINKYIEETYFFKGKGCMDRFVRWIEDNDEGIKYILIGYNNSRFDNFPLLRSLISSDLYTSMMYVQNSILQLRFGGRHTCFDLCRFVMCSLDKACDDFKVYPHKERGFSHYEPEDAFFKGGWLELDNWIENNNTNLEKYNKIDVLATENLFYIVRIAYEKLTGKNILDYTTLASLSYDRFKELNKATSYKIPAPVSLEDDKYIREAIIGGRCQDFKTQKDNKDSLACVDVKSLYPYIMMNRFFPYGDYKKTKIYEPTKLGIYTVTIKTQPKIKIIPLRDETKSLDWDYEKELVHQTLTSIEIECLKRHGGEVIFEVMKGDTDGNIGIYWEKSTDKLFRTYFEPIKEAKTEQDILAATKDPKYNPALRNITKLLLNSLSGKQVQRNFTDTTELIKNIKEEKKFEDKTKDYHLKMSIGPYRLLSGNLNEDKIYKTNRAKPSYLGVFIYAHSRTYMYDILYSNYDVLYTDTDSGILNNSDWNDFKGKYIKTIGKDNNRYYALTNEKTNTPALGKEFGQFEEELESEGKKSESYIIGKKMYCIEIKNQNNEIDGHSKYRLKGINIFKDRLISYEERQKITAMKEGKVDYIYKLKKSLDKEFDDKIAKFKTDNNIAEAKPHHVAEANKFIEIFRELNTGKAYFLCGGIKKTDQFVMKQAYSIKTLTSNGDTIEHTLDQKINYELEEFIKAEENIPKFDLLKAFDELISTTKHI
jgi:hypothetical protein